MSDEDSLLDQADALMRRQRLFAAGRPAEDAPGLDKGGDFDPDDLPLLTEVVGAGPPRFSARETATDPAVARLLAERHALLARQLDKWLDEQLPQLVILAMDGITDHLVALIGHRARSELMPLLTEILHPADDGDRPG